MGSGKHKHKSKKKKHHHRHGTDSEDYERHKHKRHHKEKKEKPSLTKLVDAYGSTDSSDSDDVIIVSAPPPPKISRRSTPSPPPAPFMLHSSNRTISSPPINISSPDSSPHSNRHLSPDDVYIPPAPNYSANVKNYASSSSEMSLSVEETNRLRIKLGLKPLENKSKPASHPVTNDIPPPPPPPPSSSSSSNDASLSVADTNILRIKLGLKPLEPAVKVHVSDRDEGTKETFGGVDMGDFVHKPAENVLEKKTAEKIREKLLAKREKRLLEKKLSQVKRLADSDSDEDVSKWVQKNRMIVSEREKAEKMAKELDAMDEVFGLGDLIEEDMKYSKKTMYSSANLKGLKVEHSMENFVEGRDVVLTLKDKGVLDEDDDTLVNVNMLDEERYKKNIDRRKQKPGYRAYEDDDEFVEYGSAPDKGILRKYDEELQGEKKSAFSLGVDNSTEAVEAARKESIRIKLQQQAGKRLESLSVPSMHLANDYYTEEEINMKFKKPKKKVRKIRKVKPLKADDLLDQNSCVLQPPPAPFIATEVKHEVKHEPANDWLRDIGTRRYTDMNGFDEKPNLKVEPMDLDIDDLPAPPDVSDIKIEEDEEDDNELQVALKKARKLKQTEMIQNKLSMEKMIKSSGTNDMDNTAAGGFIVLNETAEFCRTLGDIPTYGQAGNREDAQQLMDFEREMKEEKKRKLDKEESQGGWNAVEIDKTAVDITSYEKPILDAEPDLGTGVAGALKLAVSKGYVEREKQNRASASKFAHLQAQNYSIEDKTFVEDDKHSRRERYCGPTSDFKEKNGYKPNIKLQYIDDDGHLLCAKEAFRYLSHKFHGKGPGKNKIEKRMKKSEQEALMKHMSSTDTPLGTLNMLQLKQKETQSAFVVLSGSKQGQSTSIAKLKL